MDIDYGKYISGFSDSLANYGPKILAALVILIIAYIIGKLLARAVRYLIDKTGFGQRASEEGQSIGASIGKAVFWVVMLVAMPAILGALGMEGLLAPLQDMANKFMSFIPNLFGAGLIFFIGFIVATVVRKTIESVLQASRADQWAERAGLANVTGETGISKFAGLLAFTLIIIPIAIAALDALQMTAISTPAKAMLGSVMDAIPNIFAASVVMLIAFLISKFAGSTISNLLPATGIDKVSKSSALGEFLGNDRKPSALAGQLAALAIMIFGLIEAAKLLNFAILSDMLAQVLSLGGSILLGSVIIAFGVFAAGIVAKMVASASAKGSPMPGLVKTAIIILASAMGLRQMGVANEIVTMGFSLMMGAIALGSAIAIGFGGQDSAKKLMAKWTQNL